MHTTKYLQECRYYAAILFSLSYAFEKPFWCNDLCRMLFSQHGDLAMMHNYYVYIVLANVNGHYFGLDYGVCFRFFRHIGFTSA